jgi:hypothetical protein
MYLCGFGPKRNNSKFNEKQNLPHLPLHREKSSISNPFCVSVVSKDGTDPVIDVLLKESFRNAVNTDNCGGTVPVTVVSLSLCEVSIFVRL